MCRRSSSHREALIRKIRQDGLSWRIFESGGTLRISEAARLWLGGNIQLGALRENGGGIEFKAVELIKALGGRIVVACEFPVGDLRVDFDRFVRGTGLNYWGGVVYDRKRRRRCERWCGIGVGIGVGTLCNILWSRGNVDRLSDTE